jgi:hypothetical protein
MSILKTFLIQKSKKLIFILKKAQKKGIVETIPVFFKLTYAYKQLF